MALKRRRVKVLKNQLNMSNERAKKGLVHRDRAKLQALQTREFKRKGILLAGLRQSFYLGRIHMAPETASTQEEKVLYFLESSDYSYIY